MPELENSLSIRWLTAITINEKITGVTIKEIFKELEEENIEARPVWKPLHTQPLYQKYKYYPHSKGENVSEQLFQTGICLPSGSSMKLEDQIRVIECIKRILKPIEKMKKEVKG
jgi:pyridoxal phosphate-dependent aminotransferase EpsN